MKEFKNRPEFTPKYKNDETALAATAALADWEPTTVLCPKCGGKHTAFNKMCVLTSYPEQYQYKCSDCGHRWAGYEVQNLSPMQTWPNLEIKEPECAGQMGWICPKCGRVYSPTTNQCLFCGGTYSPNIVYCGPNNGTITISNTVDSSKIKAAQNTQSNNLKYEDFMKQHGE